MPGFDFTAHMRALCREIIHLPDYRHIDLGRVAITFAQTRAAGLDGLHATLTPLRFENGSRYGRHGGRPVRCQRLLDSDGREMLYLLSFYLPRFLDLVWREKLVTVFHELWHISPAFDGDFRRHPGRCYAHSRSQAEYDARMEALVDKWLRREPPRACYAFLESTFDELRRRHGRVYGFKIPQPKLLPLDA